MTYRLVDDADAVAALAARVSERTGLPLAHVEKDFWVTEVLRGVTAAARSLGVEVVFKGGTSLSKAYALIERFSEDVDVLVILPNETRGAKDRILKALVFGAAQATTIEPQGVGGATTKGEKRGARFHYRSGHHLGVGLSEGVFLEIGSRGGAMPTSTRAIRSLVAEHAGDLVVDAVEVEPVEVRVLHPSRTLIEKLVLLHTAHTDSDPAAAIRGARHYYDIHQLLAQQDVLDGVADAGVTILARDVCTYSAAAERAAEPRPVGGFGVSPVFTNGPHVAAVRAEYETRVLQLLLWPGATKPSFDDCIAAVHAHRQIL